MVYVLFVKLNNYLINILISSNTINKNIKLLLTIIPIKKNYYLKKNYNKKSKTFHFLNFLEKQTIRFSLPKHPWQHSSHLQPQNPSLHIPRPPIHLPTNPSLSLTCFLFQNSSSSPHSVALIDANFDEILTFRQLKLLVSMLAHSLLHLNVHTNDVILIVAEKSLISTKMNADSFGSEMESESDLEEQWRRDHR